MLASAVEFLLREVKPHAEAIDGDVAAMTVAFKGMQDLGLLAMKRSPEYGGPGMVEGEFRQFQEEIARASGALAFLQTQHQSAVSLLGKHARSELRDEYLPEMHSTRTVGLGFSQLRRRGEPLVKATPVKGGYEVSGHVPWVTGFGFFHEYILGGALPSGEAVFALVPLKDVEGQVVSAPMQLTAMQAAQTVTANLNNLFIPESKVAFVKHPGWMNANDAFNVTLQGHFAIGCAMAGIDVVRANHETRGIDFLRDTANQLQEELESCRKSLIESQNDFGEDTAPERLNKRAWAIDLMMRCAQSAVVSSSGAANYSSHPAGRILREAIVFSVSAQTQPIMQATLRRFVQSAQ
jgi:alkylation response protein AidB-like acyl-CoA dehydrogenase